MADSNQIVFNDRSSYLPLSVRLNAAANTIKSIFNQSSNSDKLVTLPSHAEHEVKKFGEYDFNIYHLPAENPKRVVYLLGGFGDTFTGNQILGNALNFFNISLIYGQLPDIGNRIGFMPLYDKVALSFFRKETKFSKQYQNVTSDLWGYSVGGQCLLNALVPKSKDKKIIDDNTSSISHRDIFESFDGLIVPIAPFLSTKARLIPPKLKKIFYQYAALNPNKPVGESKLEKTLTAYFQLKGLEVFGPQTKMATWAQAAYLRKQGQAIHEKLKTSHIPQDLVNHPRLLILQGANDSVSNPSLTLEISKKLQARKIRVAGAFHYLFTPGRTQNLLSAMYQGHYHIPTKLLPEPHPVVQRKPFEFVGKPLSVLRLMWRKISGKTETGQTQPPAPPQPPQIPTNM